MDSDLEKLLDQYRQLREEYQGRLEEIEQMKIDSIHCKETFDSIGLALIEELKKEHQL